MEIANTYSEKLRFAEQQGIINAGQRIALERILADTPDTGAARFGFSHVLYYFGGLIAIGALSLFATLGFEALGYGFLLIIGIAYLVLAICLTEWLLPRGHQIPAGITAALAVSLVPLVVFCLQNLLGFWSYDNDQYRDFHHYIGWRWILMELATLTAGAIALWRYRLPFLMMPVAVVGWYLSMDLARFWSEYPDSWGMNRPVSIAVGLAMVAASLWLDKRTRRQPDLGFWLCLFGALAFWVALSWSNSAYWLSKHIYALLSIGMIFTGALLNRRIFTILGALSFSGYLSWLAYSVFSNSILFPVVLCFIGLGIVAFGIWWQRHEPQIVAAISRYIQIDVVR